MDAYANVEEIITNIDRFRRFYEENKNIHFPHKATRKLYPGSAVSNAITYTLED